MASPALADKAAAEAEKAAAEAEKAEAALADHEKSLRGLIDAEIKRLQEEHRLPRPEGTMNPYGTGVEQLAQIIPQLRRMYVGNEVAMAAIDLLEYRNGLGPFANTSPRSGDAYDPNAMDPDARAYGQALEEWFYGPQSGSGQDAMDAAPLLAAGAGVVGKGSVLSPETWRSGRIEIPPEERIRLTSGGGVPARYPAMNAEDAAVYDDLVKTIGEEAAARHWKMITGVDPRAEDPIDLLRRIQSSTTPMAGQPVRPVPVARVSDTPPTAQAPGAPQPRTTAKQLSSNVFVLSPEPDGVTPVPDPPVDNRLKPQVVQTQSVDTTPAGRNEARWRLRGHGFQTKPLEPATVIGGNLSEHPAFRSIPKDVIDSWYRDLPDEIQAPVSPSAEDIKEWEKYQAWRETIDEVTRKLEGKYGESLRDPDSTLRHDGLERSTVMKEAGAPVYSGVQPEDVPGSNEYRAATDANRQAQQAKGDAVARDIKSGKPIPGSKSKKPLAKPPPRPATIDPPDMGGPLRVDANEVLAEREAAASKGSRGTSSGAKSAIGRIATGIGGIIVGTLAGGVIDRMMSNVGDQKSRDILIGLANGDFGPETTRRLGDPELPQDMGAAKKEAIKRAKSEAGLAPGRTAEDEANLDASLAHLAAAPESPQWNQGYELIDNDSFREMILEQMRKASKTDAWP